MQNHKQDSYDGGRAASLTPDPATDVKKKPPKKIEDPDELALALALLALTEGRDL